MLTVNQNILVDFASKEAVHVTDFKYKQGEIDKSGINIDIASASITENTVLKVNWLYAADYDYVYVQNDGDYISSTKMKIYPPQNTLLPGLVAFEILLVEMSGETPLSQLKGPSVYIPVAEALIDDEEASMEDENIAAIISLINENDRLIGVVEQLDADVRAAEAVRDQNETNRNNTLDTKVSTVNSTVATANTAKTNADNAAANANTKATLANDKATLANTARDAANAAKTAADTAKSAADTATINANNAATAANNAATAANTAATSANTAAVNANNAATAANTAADRATAAISSSNAAVAEISQARVDMSGTTHASIGARMNSDFNTLASAVPKEIAVSGTETVVSNDTLSGEVSSAVLTGQTMVNNVTTQVTAISGYGTFPKSVGGKDNTTYTVVINGIAEGCSVLTSFIHDGQHSGQSVAISVSNIPYKFTTGVGTASGFRLRHREGAAYVDGTISSCILLEGDHTDKPLEFFEGLKSAEVSEVTSHGVNLVSEVIEGKYQNNDITNGNFTISNNSNYCISNFVKVRPDFEYRSNFYDGAWYSDLQTPIKTVKYPSTKIAPRDAKYLVLTTNISNKSGRYIYEVTPNTPTEYIPYQESKVTLPSPIILRSLPNGVTDTYDVDTGVLIRRCGEVVLNGSESWGTLTSQDNDTTKLFTLQFSQMINNTPVCIADKLKYLGNYSSSVIEDSIFTGGVDSRFYIRVAKSKLPTPDVAGFKAWLSANPTTVVYQLAEPTTEVINHDGYLRSYDGQTTLTADSVVPADLKSNIPINLKAWLESQNVTMAMLANDASIQAAMMEQIEEEQKVQSAEISSAQLALIDLYEMGL